MHILVRKNHYDCKICLDEISSPLYLPCAHGFCGLCVVRLIKSRLRRCPICRQRITWTISAIYRSYPKLLL